jgi:hypothetical protein
MSHCTLPNNIVTMGFYITWVASNFFFCFFFLILFLYFILHIKCSPYYKKSIKKWFIICSYSLLNTKLIFSHSYQRIHSFLFRDYSFNFWDINIPLYGRYYWLILLMLLRYKHCLYLQNSHIRTVYKTLW